jgi:hypothetical protein
MQNEVSAIEKLQLDYWDNTVATWAVTLKPEAFTQRCTAATPGKHAQWLGLIHQLDKTTRDLAAAYSKYATGLNANIATTPWHNYLTYQIDSVLNNLYYVALFGDTVFPWAGAESTYKLFCAPGTGTPPAHSDWPSPTYEPSPACPTALKGVNVKLKMGIFDIELQCEKIKIEAVAKGGLVDIFGNVSVNPWNGQTTVEVGPKIGQDLGPFQATVKGGFYITVGKNGISDFGERFSAYVTLPTWEQGSIMSTKLIEAKGELSFATGFKQ